MTMIRKDNSNEEKKRQIKYMSKMQVTHEMIPFLLNIPNPEDIRLKTMYDDPSREIVTFVFEGDNARTGSFRLFEMAEGAEIPNQVLETEELIEVMRQKVKNWDEAQAKKGEDN